MHANKRAPLALLIIGLVYSVGGFYWNVEDMQKDGKDRTGNLIGIVLIGGAWNVYFAKELLK